MCWFPCVFRFVELHVILKTQVEFDDLTIRLTLSATSRYLKMVNLFSK
jgi:hypothetical protein